MQMLWKYELPVGLGADLQRAISSTRYVKLSENETRQQQKTKGAVQLMLFPLWKKVGSTHFVICYKWDVQTSNT